MSRVHVIGAGMAGLSAAVELARAGRPVSLYEAGPAAGGRCRSYFDRELGCRIDNGNHLLLSGNTAAMDYLETIGARDTMLDPGGARFRFHDIPAKLDWTVRPGAGRIPWWVLSRRRGVPGVRLAEYLGLLALRRARPGATVADVLAGPGQLWRRLLEPLAVAALNTPPETALASLLAVVVEQSLMRGGRACIPLVPREGLSESLVDPALAYLAARGADLHTGRRITALHHPGPRVVGLETTDGPVALGPGEACVLAVPSWVAAGLLPGLVVPNAFEAIANVHYLAELDPPGQVVGVVGGTAEWIFLKDQVVSITISAANRLADMPNETLAARCWDDVRAVCNIPPGAMPKARVVREKRATFAATAAQEARRPHPRTALANLVLAGDWTATGLPATIEGAIRSGCTAAKLLGHGSPN